MNYSKLVWLAVAVLLLAGCGGAEERKALYLEKAKLSLKTGDLDKARIELKNVLQIDPKDAQAYFQLGDIFDLSKEYKKAFANYSKALELDPDNLEYHARIGTYLLMLADDIDAAIKKSDLILAKDSTNVSGLLLKAGILSKKNDLIGAKKLTQDIFSRNPEHIQNAIFLSTIYLAEKKHNDAINVLKACIKDNPENDLLINILASTYSKAGESVLAEKHYKEILERNPENFLNYLKLALFYKEMGNVDKGESILRKSIHENTEDVARKSALIDFIQHSSGNQSAIKELNRLVAEDKNIAKLRLRLATLYIAEKNIDEAKKVLESVVSDFSEDLVGVKARVSLSKLYMLEKKFDAAGSVINDALKISPNDSEINFIKANLLLLSKDYENSIISLRIVLKDNPEKIEAYLMLTYIHQAMGKGSQAEIIMDTAYDKSRNNAKGLIILAKYYAKNKNRIKLDKVLDSYLAIDVNNYEVLSMKSALLNEKRMFIDASQFASQMLKIHPDKANGYLQSVPYMLAEDNEKAAISLLKKGYRNVDSNGRILELLVSIYIAQKSFDDAKDTVRAAINQYGETAKLNMLLAKVQSAAGQYNEAVQTLNKIIIISPEWNVPYLSLANLFIERKNADKAIETLNNGLSKIESDIELVFRLAKIYEDNFNFSEAINVYESAYQAHSNNIILLNNLASLLSEYKDDEKKFSRAKELSQIIKDVDIPMVQDTAGWIFYKDGDLSEAVRILTRAVDKAPNLAVLNYHLGMALYGTGDMGAAKLHLAKSLASNEDFPGRDDAEKHLKELE